ncbi:pyridoxamine 5'-phosphate oxidase family protein [Kordiimonas sp. SCSIO 12610]|uniref:pyridoxamine 5'-phosphate oxidase family protein n=1 Tax=Kordiimonas sp. SCSIO 12610 TaxID=2829597 RepID=UPI0021094C15|nr:pyridoxamine 5'-phosphate oxidase family protein [Kordiimonas sp. SCSIO 12610]UTW56088.1 pyridoxamine 5'-phosphate oxidase family protein [Kordiimonas sp. SCSIO 12610]
MTYIESVEELEALYGEINPNSKAKIVRQITPLYRKWIEASRFLILSTVGPEGTDASPRGDDGPVVRIVDETTVMLPDWRGNNLTDSLHNIVRDERVSLMFMVPGANNVVRLNGRAKLSIDPDITNSFEQDGKHPKSVAVITLEAIYFQCAKALMRSKLWTSGDESTGLPTAGQFVKEVKADFDAEAYDSGYAEYAKGRMW